TTPKWLLNQPILDNIDANPLEVVARLQSTTLNRLLGSSTLGKLVAAEATDGATAYKITDLFTDLNGAIFTELKSSSAIDVYRRNLQKSYVDKLIAIVNPPAPAAATQVVFAGRGAGAASGLSNSQSDVMSVVKGQLRDLDASIKGAASSQADSLSKYHLLDLADRIESALDKKKD
ncbi:MAG: hypothetical protein EOO91_08020, partial [Pedobacter sp.]